VAGVTTRLVLDTNCWIYLLDDAASSRGRWLTEHVLRPATVGRLTVLTSAVSLAELLVVPHRDGAAARAGAVRAAVEGLPGSRLVDVTPGLAQQAAAVRATTGLRLPDALVLATAAAASARLLTNDARLAKPSVTTSVLVLDEVMPGALPPA
jgi:predicted nucleic acid-binding protein